MLCRPLVFSFAASAFIFRVVTLGLAPFSHFMRAFNRTLFYPLLDFPCLDITRPLSLMVQLFACLSLCLYLISLTVQVCYFSYGYTFHIWYVTMLEKG